MENTTPFEIIGAPFTLYLAVVGTVFPAVDAAPAIAWKLVGSSGDLNYMDDGVTVDHPQNISFFRAAGDSGSRKAFRVDEDLMISLILADISLEQYALAINGNPVAATAAGVGVAGKKKLGLSRGLVLDTRALLLRGPSPYMEDGVAQYCVPIAVQTGKPKPVYRKAQAAGLALEWTALVDPNAASPAERFGYVEAQTAIAL